MVSEDWAGTKGNTSNISAMVISISEETNYYSGQLKVTAAHTAVEDDLPEADH